ncbi:hypothetical protein [Vibrio mangrovi]|uniref:Uncharacterized protein n=1 Tax=Vibrio mangrovi TaxID=474394 RepID=A0A1Y6IQJ2_9VIBR|nr:hypothetical protein [Vibrio mangrovi]MDW6003312.1 hypothetical protein [Vibrio mangrovi]SMR99898.1 hypothetical protein VIM7927_01134 [Vibrio mangrovi]
MKYLLIEHIQQTHDFDFIDWQTLTQLISSPPFIQTSVARQAKKLSKAITATDCPNKRLEDITAHNHFTLLRLDLDDTEHCMKTINDTLLGLGIHSFLVHTTASHRQDGKGNRYRVYIELGHGLNLDEWRILQTYLAYCLLADDCSNRPQQIMFLPVRFIGSEYHCHINTGSPLNLGGSQLFDDAITFDTEQKRQAQVIKQEKVAQIKPSHPEHLINGQVSIIDVVNQSYSWPELLNQYGYKRQGRAWLPPESTSKTAGAYILSGPDGKARYYSHHTSDPCATGKCIDQFDFLTLRSFAGDSGTALKALAKYFPEQDAHNKRQYIAYQQALKLHSIREGR